MSSSLKAHSTVDWASKHVRYGMTSGFIIVPCEASKFTFLSITEINGATEKLERLQYISVK